MELKYKTEQIRDIKLHGDAGQKEIYSSRIVLEQTFLIVLLLPANLKIQIINIHKFYKVWLMIFLHSY